MCNDQIDTRFFVLSNLTKNASYNSTSLHVYKLMAYYQPKTGIASPRELQSLTIYLNGKVKVYFRMPIWGKKIKMSSKIEF